MRLCTMTNIFRDRIESNEYIDYKESMLRCRNVGFKVLDLHLGGMSINKTCFNKDDWKKKAYNIRNYAEKIGVEFSQSHIPFKSGRAHVWESQEDKDFFDEITKRGVIVTGIVGAKQTVVHPVTEYIKTEHDVEASIKLNHETFDDVIDLAFKNNVNVNYENMLETDPERRFCVGFPELIELVDSYKDDRIGICWDVGHGNISHDNQCVALRAIGKRLKMTHINDNNGTFKDEHLIPYFGTTDWEAIMKTLKEINFDGDINFEIEGSKRFPDPLKDNVARLLYDIGQYLIGLAD